MVRMEWTIKIYVKALTMKRKTDLEYGADPQKTLCYVRVS
jgi:hypothetical protein